MKFHQQIYELVWIWLACRSMVSTRSAPAVVIRLATSLAEMGSREKIYELVRRIPYGKVSSYGQLAVLAGRPGAARAVGHAMRVCRDPSVPCHRVVHQDGSTTASFDAIERRTQQRLLEAEGVLFSSDHKVIMSQFQWRPEIL